jgi:proteasome-associated ATPase
MQHGHPGSQPDEGGELNQGNNSAELTAQIRFLEDEIASLRRKLTESPRHVRLLEQRLAEATERVSQLTERNTKLIDTLREARSQLLALREEVDRLAQPPSGYGVFMARFDDGTVDVRPVGPPQRGADRRRVRRLRAVG